MFSILLLGRDNIPFAMKNNDYHNLLLRSLPQSYQTWFTEEKKYLEKHITPEASILEVGSGDGRSIFDLITITKNIIGIDHDEKAVHEADARFREFETIKFIKAHAETLPFKNQSFDFVICMTSLANFADKKLPILQEMKRVLKDSGKIIISVFSQNALEERLKVYKNLNVPIKEIREGTVVFGEELGDNISEQFTKEELKNIFKQAELFIEDITEVNMAYLCLLTKQ
jgi:ubiquinone/menaquinone biosynthesis C-methylase UbiE